MPKGQVERTYKLDIGSFKESFKTGKRLKGEVSIGKSSYPIVVAPEGSALYIDQLELNVTTTDCNYGGVRYWFVCPSCASRVSKLYIRGGVLCRVCAGLNYKSQQRTKTDCNYYLDLMEEIAHSIDKNFEVCPVYPSFPNKPNGMQRRVYFKLWNKFWEYKRMRDQLWMRGALHILNRGRR